MFRKKGPVRLRDVGKIIGKFLSGFSHLNPVMLQRSSASIPKRERISRREDTCSFFESTHYRDVASAAAQSTEQL